MRAHGVLEGSAEAAPPAGGVGGRGYLAQACGGLLWGVFFSVTPIVEGLLPTALLWIPLFALRERHRAARYGTAPGLWIRLGAMAALMGVALLLPLKPEDQPLKNPLSGETVTLGELREVTALRCAPGHEFLKITLPSRNPTLRQVAHALETQTRLECSTSRCFSGSTLLTGAGLRSLTARPRE